MKQSSPAVCPRCGAMVDTAAVGTLCPHCVMAMNAATETDLAQAASGPSRMTVPAFSEPQEPPNSLIGRYKIREKIGEGGWGIVYVAEQQNPVRRRVALKVIKPGMDTRNVVARFEAERQALAMMDHPNIAKVFDGGATDAGRPYFVMELVRGIRITDYCDQNQLSTRQRLELFVQVCHAIQHAHQKGIIHRDIKPSNIMVMLADDLPVPKVIDFGVAKAMGERLGDKTTYTRFDQFIGTPAYTSPEQAGMSGLDVDTRSDIYALGVLLYELLTGRTPFEGTTPESSALEEVLRRIREEDAPKPSTLLNRLDPKARTTTAQRRATEPLKLVRSLRGDLDWIVMKCLEKNRARRYATANDLARDVDCYLKQQPVSAAAPTLRYRAFKWLRRHRRAAETAAAFGLLLILAAAGGTWLARRAGEAEREQAKLENVRWALETALPQIERAIENDDLAAAFTLVERVRPLLNDNPGFRALSARVVSFVSIQTEPAGADVFIRDYNDLSPEWAPIGKSPLRNVKFPRGFKRWKAALPGHDPAEGAFFAGFDPTDVGATLYKVDENPPQMVRIKGERMRTELSGIDTKQMPILSLPDFLLDRYEVTNQRFQEFVDAGGYAKPEYWKHRFIKDGTELSWQTAMKLFVDQTGQPGPATWRNGRFPEGQEDYPVGGVSWYEAAAFAEFSGMSLPTVYHWSLAAGDSSHVDVGFLIPLSNFGGKGPARAGSRKGMTSLGIYDMAGNVKEWCFNEAPEGNRVIAGGGWNDPEYMFRWADKYPPFFREAHFGFRCMRTPAEDGVWEKAAGKVAYQPRSQMDRREPCSDEVFEAYRKLYDYGRRELLPRLEASEDITAFTRREKISFDAGYGAERTAAYVFLPRAGKPPFQTIIYFPGDGAWAVRSIADYGSPETYEAHTRQGRAFVFPVLYGTFERQAPPGQRPETTPVETRIKWMKEFRRTVDFLESRPDQFDLERLAYEGLSRGGVWGGILPGIEPRIKAVVIFGGGLVNFPAECSQCNFAPRILVPVLIQNGKYDFIFPVETHQKPFFALFGTPEANKHLKIYETGHSVWYRNEVRKDELAFLDECFGPVK